MNFNFKPHHISLQVADLNDSVSFYHLLGFNEVFRYEDKELIIVHLSNQDFIIELFFNKDILDGHSPAQISCKKNGKIKHFSLKVDNIQEAYDSLVSLSIKTTCGITYGRTKIKYFFILDPDNNEIEIVQDNRFDAYEEKNS